MNQYQLPVGGNSPILDQRRQRHAGRTHRTPEFLEAQRRLTRSGAECRLMEREIVDLLRDSANAHAYRVDEVQRGVYELRRRLRALEKAGAAPIPRKTSAAKPARKARRSSRRV
jgi:hypothetical protein